MANDFRRPLNYKFDKLDERDYKFKTASVYEKLRAVRPSSIDWSSNMSRIKDQGQLGSCVGFAMVAMKEWQEITERIMEQKEYGPTNDELKDLSESYVYWNAKAIDGDPEEGTTLRVAMQVLKNKGVPTERFWPYSDKTRGEALDGADTAAEWTKIGSYWRVTSLEELLTALSKQPVPIGISCFEEIFSVGSNGLVPLPKNPALDYGGHAICLVGYDDEKRLLKFKNSWSTAWGQNGYGYLSYDYFEYIIDAWTCLDLKVTGGEVPVTPPPADDDKDDDKKKKPIVLFIAIGVAVALALIGSIIKWIF